MGNELDNGFHESALSRRTCCPVLELRQYTLHPGKRDELIELFEREFIESQEAVGMTLVGQFRDLDNPDRFVWFRGFADMLTRARALEEFYGGPIWKAHREAANATMIDSDNVLLLRPSPPASGFPLANASRPSLGAAERPRGLLVATIYHLTAGSGADFADFFARELEPVLREMGAPALASFVTENHPNTFPALPVHEEANVFVRFSLFSDRAAYERYAAAFAEALAEKGGANKLSALIEGQPEVLLLEPTVRSLLRGEGA